MDDDDGDELVPMYVRVHDEVQIGRAFGDDPCITITRDRAALDEAYVTPIDRELYESLNRVQLDNIAQVVVRGMFLGNARNRTATHVAWRNQLDAFWGRNFVYAMHGYAHLCVSHPIQLDSKWLCAFIDAKMISGDQAEAIARFEGGIPQLATVGLVHLVAFDPDIAIAFDSAFEAMEQFYGVEGYAYPHTSIEF
jgi:hypothetical protein